MVYVVHLYVVFGSSDSIIITVNPTLATHPLLFPDPP